MSSNEGRPRHKRQASVTRRVTRGFDPARFITARGHRTVPDIARASDVGESTIRRWERGDGTPEIPVLVQVLSVIGVEIDEVICIPRDERYPGDWRTLLGLTQPQLAAKAGISTIMLGRIERGQVWPLHGESIARLAHELGIDVAELRRCYERARSRPIGSPA